MNKVTSSTQHTSTIIRPTIIRLPEVLQTVGLSRASIYRLMKLGQFPQQVRLGMKAVGWLRVEVEQWITSLSQARPGSMPEQGLTSQRTAA